MVTKVGVKHNFGLAIGYFILAVKPSGASHLNRIYAF